MRETQSKIFSKISRDHIARNNHFDLILLKLFLEGEICKLYLTLTLRPI